MSVYYNEHDRDAARWLGNLAEAGLIPSGTIDGRDIQEVTADDVRGFRECHFFAGIGGWPYALRLAGFPATEPVWTGSCPCQPFSLAGKRKGEADPRHLWPVLLKLIAECRPPTIFGEQVESKAGRRWLAGVRADLEALGYRFGAADLCAAGAGEEAEGRIRCGDQIWYERIRVGAPHIRQRLFWVADTRKQRRKWWEGVEPSGWPTPKRSEAGSHARDDCVVGRLGDSRKSRLSGRASESGGIESQLAASQRAGCDAGGMEHSESDRRNERRTEPSRGSASSRRRPGFWSDFDLIDCRDEKTRRIESGSQCLVDGFSFRLADGRSRQDASRAAILKGFGNAIVPPLAVEFIRAYMEAR